jgi:hypothetical protein
MLILHRESVRSEQNHPGKATAHPQELVSAISGYSDEMFCTSAAVGAPMKADIRHCGCDPKQFSLSPGF